MQGTRSLDQSSDHIICGQIIGPYDIWIGIAYMRARPCLRPSNSEGRGAPSDARMSIRIRPDGHQFE